MTSNGHATTVNGIDPASLSPSLRVFKALGPAYEIKFLLDDDLARDVEHRLSSVLRPDPHADPALGGMYEIRSLACDTPALGVFHRDERLRNRKYRVRRYGEHGPVFLERKRSSNGRVRKHRVPASPDELAVIARGEGGHPSQMWFARAVRNHELKPVCRITYMRRALYGSLGEGPVRVTFDRSIRGVLAHGWDPDVRGDERTILPGVVVCEFKFRSAMPAPLKAVVAAMALEPTGVSKYRTCVRAFATELGVHTPSVGHSTRGGATNGTVEGD